MDFKVYLQAMVNGVPLALVVLALVWWYGKGFGWQGRTQFISSMVTGLALGMGFVVSQTQPPGLGLGWWTIFGYWFGAGVYGVGLGLLASGVYEVGKDLFTKIIEKFLAGLLPGGGGG